MKKKIIFVDVDGTLCNDQGLVPESAAQAIVSARKNGHLVYLCTGRSKAEIYDFIYNIGFDGVIGAGGGYIQVGDDMLVHKKVKSEDVKHMVDYFSENEIEFYLESNGGLYASPGLVNQLKDIMKQIGEPESNHFIESMITGEDLYRDDINKACFLDNGKLVFSDIVEEFSGEFSVYQATVHVFGPNSGELGVPDVHKANAIEELLEHLGLDQADTIAIGDGLNDVEMLDYCATGIAMGNAKDGLKAIADYITTTHDEDGIANAFKHYQLID